MFPESPLSLEKKHFVVILSLAKKQLEESLEHRMNAPHHVSLAKKQLEENLEHRMNAPHHVSSGKRKLNQQ